MGLPPAVVIVVRHGARLDQADKQWHLNSPTPYDPPLTYGGWTQCRTLGVRIAELLQTREHMFEATQQDEESGNDANGNTTRTGRRGRPRKKKHRIVLHSSPFLRCVQTSVAIGSGISQFNGLNGQARTASRSRGPPSRRSRGETSQERPEIRLSTITDEDGEVSSREDHLHPPRPTSRTKLRLDAFLGEWLSPSYYESITPPPSSVLMLASAKSELLHRGEPIAAEEQQPQHRSSSVRSRVSSSGGLWGSPVLERAPSDFGDDTSINDGEEMLPPGIHPVPRERSSSHGASDRSPTSPRLSKRGSHGSRGGYMPPTPLYAISPFDPIPAGYVAHARDYCVDVDFQWDSMRSPQNWGDGGHYGEEWSAMHRRFRHGLHAMINYYRHHFESSHQLHGHLRTLHPPRRDAEDDEDTDLVLVLVTHSAGCNALIGALTNQPVLIDIGVSSLTMAVRRDRPLSPPPTASSNGRRVSVSSDPTLSQEYEVSLTASTDHLRPGSASSTSSTPAPIELPPAMGRFVPGALQRSNTLPIRPTPAPPPPKRHVSPAPSRHRSTSISKISFVPSPLNPNINGVPSSPVQQKTWLESHKPQPQKSWMDAHKAAPAPAPAPTLATNEAAKPGLFRSDSGSPGTGLWSAQTANSSPGLWQQSSSIPRSGLGSAATADKQTWQPPKEAQKPVGWLGQTSNLNTNLSPSSAERRISGNNSPKSDTKSVKFAESVKGIDDDDDDDDDIPLSPLSRSSTRSILKDSAPKEEVEDVFPDEMDEHEVARLSRLPSTDVKVHRLNGKRRWTMNDERTQERDGSDWRMEQWM